MAGKRKKPFIDRDYRHMSYTGSVAGTFAERLNILMVRDNVKQTELAEYLDKSEPAISTYLNGKKRPDFETVIQIADRFNTTIDYLFGRTDTQSIELDNIIACKVTGLNGEAIKRLTELKPQYSPAINTFLTNRYATNILSAINTISELKPYTDDELYRYETMRQKCLGSMKSELEKAGLNQFTIPELVLADMESSPVEQAYNLATKYLTLMLNDLDKRKKGENNG